MLEPLRASHPADAGLALTQRNFEAKRKEAYVRAAGSVRSDRFRTAVLDLVAWVETGDWGSAGGEHRKALRARAVAEHAKAELSKLRKRIKRKGSDIRHLSVKQRHKLRIRAKRLRYATEFFAGTFPGEASAKRRQESLAALKDVQDALGGLNDLATHHALIADGLAVDAEAGTRHGAGAPRRTRHRRDIAAQSRTSVRAACRDQAFLEGVRAAALSLRRAAGPYAS